MSDKLFNRILLVVGFIYAVSFLERTAWNYTASKENEAYRQEKEQFETTIQNLEDKLYQNEINLIKRNAGVDTLTDRELDNEWSNIFSRQRNNHP